ncbi:MAG: hypothetical protein K9N48_05765, partial [Verrucomicrobia bacterium]|nr:hypothetical protein [Verrucomicrobiota bacterium]
LLIPACLIEIWYVLSRVEDEGKGGGSGVKSWLKAQARRVAPVWSIWAGAAVVVCLIAILIAPNWNWRALVGTHAGALDAEYASPEMYRIFGSDDVLEHIIVMMMAAMACVIAYRLGRFKEMLGPLALVASLAVGHCIVRPWWFYYQVEWALILALLGVIGLRMFIIMEKPDINDFGKRRYPAIERAGFVAGTSVFAALVLVSLLFQGVNRIRGEIKILERSELVDNSPVLAKLDEYKEGAEWLFTTDREYSFYSKIPIPPEVRWLSRKRFLSGQITTEQIVDVVAQYRVRLVLIPHDEVEKAVWNEFLTNNYERVWLDAKNQLWVRKDHLESREVENEKAGNNI